MATPEPTALQRLFPRGEYFRGLTLRAGLWSLASSLLTVGLLLVGSLIVDLLGHGGTFTVSADELDELRSLAGTAIDIPASVSGTIRLNNSGLLPDAWDDRSRPWGPALARLYRTIPILQHDPGAFSSLVGLAALLGLAAGWTGSRARTLHLRYALDLAVRLRKAIHRQVMRLGPSDLMGREHEQALTLFTRDVDEVRDGVVRCSSTLVRDPPLVCFLAVLALSVHPVLMLQCSIPLCAVWFLILRARRRSSAQVRLSESLADKEVRLLSESLAKSRLVRGYGMEVFEQELFSKYLQRFHDLSASSLHMRRWAERGIGALAIVVMAFVLFLVGSKVLFEPQQISFAAGVLLMGTLATAFPSLDRLSCLAQQQVPAEQAAVRIQAYLNKIPEVGQAVGAKFLQPLSRLLEFDNVTYGTADRPRILDGLSMKIPAGRQVAIISTDPLAARAVGHLLPRFIEPQHGRILVDGEDIAWVTLESLRAEVLLVAAASPYLTGTIAENIGGGDSRYSLQEITEAAKLTHAHQFILKLPQGYETVIGEHGETLDVGQLFRLGLARAVVRKPALLVVEEPDELLDDDTKALLDDAYKRIGAQRTVIMLPTRLSTLRRADEIVFLHKGQVEGVGTREMLVKSSPLYRHWEYVKYNEFRFEFDGEG